MPEMVRMDLLECCALGVLCSVPARRLGDLATCPTHGPARVVQTGTRTEHHDWSLVTDLSPDDPDRWWACYEPERPADMKVCYLLTCSKCRTKARLDLTHNATFMSEAIGPERFGEFTDWATASA